MRRGVASSLRALASISGVWLILQVLPRWLPEDAARIAAGEWASESEVAALRHALHLDLPLPQALLHSLDELIHGSLGTSLRFRRPVAELLRSGIPVSLQLACFSLVLSAVLAWMMVGASQRARWLRAAAVASPVYVAGPLLLWAVAQHVRWLPVAGFQGWTTWILPCLALAIPLAGHQSRILAAQLLSLRESLGLRTWEAAGIPKTTQWVSWVFPAVAGPWLTVVGLQLGGLLGGAVLTETIFSLPGLGLQLVGALSARDLPMLQGTVLVGAVFYVATQLAVEWGQGFLDPRTR